MTRGPVPRPVSKHNAKGCLVRSGASFHLALLAICSFCRSSGKAGIVTLVAGVLIFWLGAMSLPLMAEGANATSPHGEDFGQYLTEHQAELAPFFTKNAGELFKLGIPLLMGMAGWIIFITMLVGWGIDVLMSRGFAFFFAPAFTELKRAFIYATGRLSLSFVYTVLTGLAIVFSSKLTHGGIVMALVVILLLVVALAAQIVWILYLFRTNFSVSVVFYIAIIVVHSLAGILIAVPVLGWRASGTATDFVDQVITPKLQAEAESTKHELAVVESARDVIQTKVTDLQNQIAQSQADQEQMRQEVEEKKNSDVYVFGRIVQAHARGDLDSARDQLTAFLAKFPSSSLDALAQAQLAEVSNELAVDESQKKQQEADAARAAAAAQADLLARAGKGDVTLSEMRQALIGKTRAQVSNLLGLPSETASDSWGYTQQMILNPMTNEKHGLTVYFTEGTVQGVDYDRNGESP